MTAWIEFFLAPIKIFKINHKQKILGNDSNFVATFRTAKEKPMAVEDKGFSLFYRSRPLIFLVKISLLTGLAIWTIKNYYLVFKSL